MHLEFTLDNEENNLHSMQLHLNIEEMIEFTAKQDLSLILIDESPDTLVGQSLFQLQLGEDDPIYQGKGRSIGFTIEAWPAVDEHSFMVTEVSLPQVILNSSGIDSCGFYCWRASRQSFLPLSC